MAGLGLMLPSSPAMKSPVKQQPAAALSQSTPTPAHSSEPTEEPHRPEIVQQRVLADGAGLPSRDQRLNFSSTQQGRIEISVQGVVQMFGRDILRLRFCRVPP